MLVQERLKVAGKSEDEIRAIMGGRLI